MCVFTYDCFSYLLIYFLQIFVSKDFTAPLLIVWFYEQRLTEERASPASPLQGEERGLWEYRSVVNAGDLSPS